MAKTSYLKLAKMVADGAPVLGGYGSVEKPRYFFVGNNPTPKDILIGKPFSGPMADVIDRAINILNDQLMKAGEENAMIRKEDCYYTYFLKALLPPKFALTEEYVRRWLPVIQREAEEVQPQNVVVLGSIAKPFAGAIPCWQAQEHKTFFTRLKEKVLG